MSWSILLLMILLLVAVIETRQLARLHSPRDMAVFYGFWGIAAAATVADMAGLTQIRPLDWIRGFMQLTGLAA
ncbi:hypothetical protein [Paenibacillus sp. S150]|uniref:hypothetical protein n=1 Tax=Paenibacillus sp. S150 TaxID=2749826 RepID=UPI001C588B7F|nr:hypothetical protein [Paenibacillus sp. S150]MBW4084511.1 hypothetical protein [Paenibacillus sp. S150]